MTWVMYVNDMQCINRPPFVWYYVHVPLGKRNHDLPVICDTVADGT